MRPLFGWTGVLFVAAIVGVVSCGGDGGPSDPDPDPDPGSVRATVTGDGDPLADVTVELYANGGATPIATLTTGANGQVLFDDLEPASYDVEVVVLAGYELAAGQTVRRDVTVQSDEIATVTFALEEIVVAPTEGQIRARVLEGAAGVEGVDVTLFSAGGVTPLATLATGADGRALFSNLDPGAYDVEIEMPDGYTVAAGDSARKPRTVVAGVTTDVEFEVEGPPVVEIIAEGTTFTPNDVTIAPGTTVRWVRVNGSHTVTPNGHSEWSEAALNGTTTTFEHTFDSTGDFPYFCSPHQSLGMTGIVRVQ